METILLLCPSLRGLPEEAQHDAVMRMCLAHFLNGGEITTAIETAEEYLRSL